MVLLLLELFCIFLFEAKHRIITRTLEAFHFHLSLIDSHP